MISAGQIAYVAYLRANFIGPKHGESEVLDGSPVYAYLTGMLFPIEDGEGVAQETLDEELLPGEAVPEDDTAVQTPFEDDSEQDDLGDLTAASGWAPSSLGLSFIHDSTDLVVTVRAARYERVVVGSEDPARGAEHWRRVPLPETVVVIVGAGGDNHQNLWDGRAKLQWRVRPGRVQPVVTVALSNTRKVELGRAKREVEDVLFQAGFTVEAVSGDILPYPGGIVVNATSEDRELDYRFRHHLSYAIGHGVAAAWGSNRPVREISTDALPTETVRPVKALSSSDQTLGMAWLGDDAVKPAELAYRLGLFVDSYSAWIVSQRSEADRARPEHHEIAAKIVDRMDRMLDRIRAGIDLLATDKTILRAFRIANRAMQMQSVGPHNPEPAWRPFQLAFILMALPSTVDAAHGDRGLVDLIWFPTGGGKTEAYLGLAAIEMVHRRLARGLDGGGTAVITRYTMRLLTAQQFQRAARLICALEVLRRQDDHPLRGVAPFSIGLLLGNSTTPSSYRDARKQLDEVRRQQTPQNPFQVRTCPWCGTLLMPPRRSSRDEAYGFRATTHSFTIRCVSDDCPFHEVLPLQVVDEAIYADPPTIVVATVDKFARLSWIPQGGALFGLDGAPYDPPSLVIQDELHLIAGPLGTIVGIYEAAIRALLSWRGTSPKVVASTATIRSAAEQIRGLMASRVAVFPPSGLDADDSHFARVDGTAAGRLYVGLMPQAFAPAWSIGQIAGRLLAAADSVSLTPAERDAYWTLVLYHNSLRELGRTVTILRDDVRDNLQRETDRGLTGRSVSGDGVFELTSNVDSHELVEVLERLSVPADAEGAIDAIAATNILSVGIDVARLGLMMVNGQPKTASEYIQATSRVGRDQVPGLVVTLYRSGKARDRSTFEAFRNFHGSFYRFVEPTSVTPWALQARRRALRSALVILARHAIGWNTNDCAGHFDASSVQIDKAIRLLVGHISVADPREAPEVERELRSAALDWEARARSRDIPLKYESRRSPEERLLKNFGEPSIGWPTMHSMRSVEKEVRIRPEGERA